MPKYSENQLVEMDLVLESMMNMRMKLTKVDKTLCETKKSKNNENSDENVCNVGDTSLHHDGLQNMELGQKEEDDKEDSTESDYDPPLRFTVS